MWKVARRSTLSAWIPERGQRHTTAQPERYNPDVNNYFTATTRGNNSGLDRFSLVGALQGSRQSAQTCSSWDDDDGGQPCVVKKVAVKAGSPLKLTKKMTSTCK
jgi:hypothetical protein